MRVPSLRWLTILPLVIVAAACADDVSVAADGVTADDELIGGRLARPGELDSTMQVKKNCTVSKVGPRHVLTAAHCINSSFHPGARIELTNAKKLGRFAPADAPNPYQFYTIERVEVEAEWNRKCVGRACNSIRQTESMADVALLVTVEDIVGVPEAAIDLSPVVDGDAVTITGYGCEDQVGGRWDYSGSRLHVAQTRVVPFDITIHEGSFIQPRDRENGVFDMLASVYLATPGPDWVAVLPVANAGADHTATPVSATDAGSSFGDGRIEDDGSLPVTGPPAAAHAGLCPGDSGGPLYRADVGDALVVVGVNANYTFSSGQVVQEGDLRYRIGGKPTSNWQTRVDGVTGLAIGEWLRSLGVNTVCTRGGCR